MAIDIDAILLDRVFQRCADRLADVASCFALARIALVLACETQAMTLFWDLVRDESGLNLTLSAMIAGLTAFGARQAWRLIARAERQSRAGTMNIRRITLRWQRLAWLGVSGCCVATLSPHADIRSASTIIACLAWVALIYFVSCTPRPPALRNASQFAGAFS